MRWLDSITDLMDMSLFEQTPGDSLGLPADTRLLGKTAQTLRFFSIGVER